jgi:hypothetical protein
LNEKGYEDVLNRRDRSILQNKLIYFISKEIQKVNSNFILTTGWYRFGPCFEMGRRGEEESLSLELFKYVLPKRYIEQIDTVCSEHVPIFYEDNSSFPAKYLEYIYSKKVDFSFLEYYYPAKHNLLELLKKIQSGTNVPEKDVTKTLIKFDSSILDKKFINKVNIPKENAERILDFTTIVGEFLSSDREGNSSIIQDLYRTFDEIVVGAVSNKNYIATLEWSNKAFYNSLKRNSDVQYQKFYSELDRRLDDYYLNLT